MQRFYCDDDGMHADPGGEWVSFAQAQAALQAKDDQIKALEDTITRYHPSDEAMYQRMERAEQELERVKALQGHWEELAGQYMDRIQSQEQAHADLLEVLQELYDVQNGPPLIKYEAAWNKAMERAQAFLATHEVKHDTR